MADETLRMIATVVDRATAPLRAIAASLRAIGNSPYMQRLTGQFRAFGRTLAPIGSLLKGAVVGGLAAVGVSAISAGAALTGLIAAMNGAKDRLDDLNSMASATGFTVQQLRQLQYVGDQQNVTWETLSASFTQMNKRLGEVRSGTGAFGKTLAKSDPAMYRALKRTKSTTEAFTVLHSALSKIKDPAQRTAFAMKYFGKSGADVAKLSMTVKEFKAMLARGNEVRGILPDDAGEKADALGDTLGELKLAVEGVVDAIGYQVFDAATEAAGAMRDWVIANREWIAQDVAGVLKSVGEWLRKVDWEAFGRNVKGAFEKVKEFFDMIGGLKGVLIGLGVALAGGPALAFASLATSMARLSAAAIGVPTAALLAIAGAGVAIYRDWDRVGPTLTAAGKAFTDIGDAQDMWDLAHKLKGFENSTKDIEKALQNSLKKGILDIAGLFGDEGGKATDAFLAAMDRLPKEIGASLKRLGDAMVEQMGVNVERGVQAFKDALSGLAAWFDATVSGPIGRLAASIGDKIEAMSSGIKSFINKIPGLGNSPTPAPTPGATPAPAPSGGAWGTTPIGKGASLGSPANSNATEATVRGTANVVVDFRNMPKGVSASGSTDGGLFKSISVNRGSAMATG